MGTKTKYAVAYACDDMHSTMFANILNKRTYDTIDECVDAINKAIESDKETYLESEDSEYSISINKRTHEYSWCIDGGDSKGFYKIISIKV